MTDELRFGLEVVYFAASLAVLVVLIVALKDARGDLVYVESCADGY